MDIEREDEPQELFEKGKAMLKRGYPKEAAECLEKALSMGLKSSPCLSLLGIAIARSGGDLSRAEELCRVAIDKEFFWPQYYRNLSEIYMIKGDKAKAIRTIESGLRVDADNSELLDELCEMGVRRRPVIPFLSRTSPINKYLGIILSKLGLRS